jgi:hypothetical protein
MMAIEKEAPAELSPMMVSTLDLHPDEQGIIRIGPYQYRFDGELEMWRRDDRVGKEEKP